MHFYNNIFASSYVWYSKFKRETPLISAVSVVLICQMTLFFLILALLKKFDVADCFNLLPSKYYFLPILFIWFFLLGKYYNKQKAEKIINSFKSKSLQERKIWAAVSIASFVLPVVIIAFILKR